MPTPYLPEYEYKGLMAHARDILRGDTSQWADRFFTTPVSRHFDFIRTLLKFSNNLAHLWYNPPALWRDA